MASFLHLVKPWEPCLGPGQAGEEVGAGGRRRRECIWLPSHHTANSCFRDLRVSSCPLQSLVTQRPTGVNLEIGCVLRLGGDGTCN